MAWNRGDTSTFQVIRSETGRVTVEILDGANSGERFTLFPQQPFSGDDHIEGQYGEGGEARGVPRAINSPTCGRPTALYATIQATSIKGVLDALMCKAKSLEHAIKSVLDAGTVENFSEIVLNLVDQLGCLLGIRFQLLGVGLGLIGRFFRGPIHLDFDFLVPGFLVGVVISPATNENQCQPHQDHGYNRLHRKISLLEWVAHPFVNALAG